MKGPLVLSQISLNNFITLSITLSIQVGYNVGGEMLTLNQIKERFDASAAFSF